METIFWTQTEYLRNLDTLYYFDWLFGYFRCQLYIKDREAQSEEVRQMKLEHEKHCKFCDKGLYDRYFIIFSIQQQFFWYLESSDNFSSILKIHMDRVNKIKCGEEVEIKDCRGIYNNIKISMNKIEWSHGI